MMADLIAFQTYRYSNFIPSNMIPRSSHKRSLSDHRTLFADKTVMKAKSTTDLSDTLSYPSDSHPRFQESDFNTLQDPRLAIGAEISPSPSSTTHHPDLSNEVAALSVKLIQAINNQTSLDDDLAATRQELELAQGKIQALEFQNEKYRRDLENKVYVKKADVDLEIAQLKAQLAQEKAQRTAAETGTRTMEQELETLTADLFVEANKMVAAAKIEREAVEKKNEQLRSQVKDTELLLASNQDQLAELKSHMQGMDFSKDDTDTRTIASTAPPSPARLPQAPGSANRGLDFAPCDPEELTPGPSCNFPNILRMICRTDLQAYDDFRELLSLSRNSKPPSRAGSGSYGGLNVMSLAGFGSGSATSSPTKVFANSPSGSLSSQTGSHIPLKETRFYKRVMLEDIEPTLRLDLAPGVSWLARRTVLSSICEGSLVVEPVPAMVKKYELPCSVCGERRPGSHNERTHRFRTSENENAQRYSLCIQCLERIRSCCEFTGYLRLILDGHLRAGDSEEEKEIWEETVRLRERMFWSRIAGGIVPLVTRPADFEEDSDNTVSNSNEMEDCDGKHLQPSNSTAIESKLPSVEEATADELEFAEIEPHNLDSDAPRPVTPDIVESGDGEYASDVPQKRNSTDSTYSVESEVSVYEEASTDVETDTPKLVVDHSEPTPENDDHTEAKDPSSS
ncbi:hypothetical protein N7495_009509 [Penicillium taxi]|uniref:uncharacterized protein n=1 Tax=Penicillium taxi TaxID=168475 RepID=UPI002545239E|nr:uncharacterized protein N7495_009509 [Penicillium taxi]KAJ5884999.1 hypothetical protein N7495_009509 [Penicillium taxi]